MLRNMMDYYMNVRTVPIKTQTYTNWSHTGYATVILKSMSVKCVINHFVSVNSRVGISRTKKALNYPGPQNTKLEKLAEMPKNMAELTCV